MSTLSRRRSRDTTRRIFFPWETRRSRFTWFTQRHFRWVAVGLVTGVLAWGLAQVEARRRAEQSTRAVIGTVMGAVEAFRVDHDGRCPTALTELVNPTDGHEPYLSHLPRDGWGRDFRFQCPGRKHSSTADVTSAGASGSFEDTDQIE